MTVLNTCREIPTKERQGVRMASAELEAYDAIVSRRSELAAELTDAINAMSVIATRFDGIHSEHMLLEKVLYEFPLTQDDIEKHRRIKHELPSVSFISQLRDGRRIAELVIELTMIQKKVEAAYDQLSETEQKYIESPVIEEPF